MFLQFGVKCLLDNVLYLTRRRQKRKYEQEEVLEVQVKAGKEKPNRLKQWVGRRSLGESLSVTLKLHVK